jgi:adenylate cyclase class 2
MQSAEIELKFPIADPGWLQSLLPALGFVLDTPRTFEHNTLYDTPGRTLRESRQLLRIRRYGELWTLTHKRKPGASAGEREDQTRYKVRIETETRVEDGAALDAVFQQLGYAPVFRYEKYRTEWSQVATTIEGPLFAGLDEAAEYAVPHPVCHLVVDETPIGVYGELEGPPAWIEETLERLGIDSGTCLTESYGRLFMAWKQRVGSAAENLTFDEVAAAERLQAVLS